ncbi:MAG: hypothetical protein HY220_03355 [Candidatus Sungbacteria bacterium]|uniref:Uncharacterized protein n=1 Tax=Candidatus Sungiibacteriota bacterium TaxID=2750080 RepID=A0A9D6LNT2_9BACT|nr:hypothetical protein [Candidatus Sungbacteria bacterium]
MDESMVRPAIEFGKDHGLIHEAVITGRKVGAGEEFWAILAHDEERFREIVALVLPKKPKGTKQSEDETSEWTRFYREVFSLELDLAGLVLPQKPKGFNWLIVVAAGLTPNRAYAECEKRFSCWCHAEDLDEATRGRNDREPTKTYAVRLRDRVEADNELNSKSANDLTREKISGVTLLERLILELWYHWKTGGHLDIDNVTLCSGSRGPGGDVPRVHWRGGCMRVYWTPPGDSLSLLRSRQAVS